MTTNWPEPGVHLGIPAEVYHSERILSCSTLLEGLRSMRALKHALAHPKKQTPAMRLGSLTDNALLEPADFRARLLPEEMWPVNPKTQKPYGSDSQKFQDFCDENPGKIVMGGDELGKIMGMIAATQEDSDNAKRVRGSLFAADRLTQVSIVADIDVPGLSEKVRMKCRPDCIVCSANVVVDLKTVRPMSFRDTGAYMWKLGMYHRASVYLRLLAAAGMGGLEWLWTLIDNDGDHDIQVFPPEPGGMIAAEAECDDLLRRYVECTKTGRWPGKNETMQTPPVPKWVLDRAMAEEENRMAFAEAGGGK